MRHRLSRNARSGTPLAVEYLAARKAYRRAGAALRKSCAAEKRRQVCGFPQAPRGRHIAFTISSVKTMRDEFLSAPAGSGTNEDIIRAQLGHLDVKDPVQWEAVAEHYESGPLSTFNQAFAVLAKHSRNKGRLDWRKFDLATLRSCPGLEAVELPLRIGEAESEGQEHAKFYGEAPF